MLFYSLFILLFPRFNSIYPPNSRSCFYCPYCFSSFIKFLPTKINKTVTHQSPPIIHPVSSNLSILFHHPFPSCLYLLILKGFTIFTLLFLPFMHSVSYCPPCFSFFPSCFSPPFPSCYTLLIHPVFFILFLILVRSVLPSLSILFLPPYSPCFSLLIHPVSPSLYILLFPLVQIVLFENPHVLSMCYPSCFPLIIHLVFSYLSILSHHPFPSCLFLLIL